LYVFDLFFGWEIPLPYVGQMASRACGFAELLGYGLPFKSYCNRSLSIAIYTT